MEIGMILTIVGVVLTVGVTVWGVRKSSPKRELRYAMAIEPLIAPGHARSNGLQVTYDGKRVHDPHILRVVVEPVGRADIGAGSFDSSRPIVFDLGAPIVRGSLNQNELGDHKFAVGAEGDSLEIAPYLIKKDAKGYSASVICEGRPVVRVTSSLRDANLLPWSKVRFPVLNTWLGSLAAWAGITALLLTTFMVLKFDVADKPEPIATKLFVVVMSLYAIGFAAFLARKLMRRKRPMPELVN